MIAASDPATLRCLGTCGGPCYHQRAFSMLGRLGQQTVDPFAHLAT